MADAHVIFTLPLTLEMDCNKGNGITAKVAAALVTVSREFLTETEYDPASCGWTLLKRKTRFVEPKIFGPSIKFVPFFCH